MNFFGTILTKLFKKETSDAAGLLRARRSLDNWIRKQRANRPFTSDLEDAISVSLRSVRREMNKLVNDAVNKRVPSLFDTVTGKTVPIGPGKDAVFKSR